MNPASLIRKLDGLEIEAILLTHAHFDHIGGVDEIRKLKGCPVYLHDLEADWLTDPKRNGSLRWPELGVTISSDPAEYALDDRMTLSLIGTTFKVMHTPGHSPGSVSFLMDNHLFGGDVLFRQSVGRTDLPGGNADVLYDSIHEKLFTLDDGVIVYPGHGPRTTIGYERDNNPYV
jgi:glyoxylase-like metal-dependent hydrolase (beta-lactamase superfamily II)